MKSPSPIRQDQGKQERGKKIEQSVFSYEYRNGCKIEVVYHHKRLRGEINEDRIQLLISPEGRKTRGWLMTQMEAVDIINGLSNAILIAMEDNILPAFKL